MSNKAIEEYLKEKAAEKAKHAAEIQRLADADSRRRAAEAAERRKAMEAEDKRREEQFEHELEEEARALFFGGNGNASEALYKTVRDEYRGLVLRQRAEAAARDTSHSLYRW
ncbi:MAG TPA: hypothetical protein VJ866_14280 [Pyrinomonadaceae bacterium]|nr:hypothetical protein [Pyrinomonadaceae bacterium]